MAGRAGNSNARKKLPDLPAAPWLSWSEAPRTPARAIRWIETYCRLPKGYGSGQLMVLAPFQREWLEAVLAPGVDSAVMSVPRGNGKSTFLAAVALWALFDADPVSGAAQVPIVATTVNQATRAVYSVALAMIRADAQLEDRSLIYSAIGASKVVVPATMGRDGRVELVGGEMFPISNDVDGLQGLDPSLAVCDEIGFMPPDSWNSLLLAGIKRPRSLVVGIGTPGLDKDNALWALRTRIREGAAVPGFVFTEYAADEGCDLSDESQWFKANPALAAGYQRIESLRTNRELTLEGPFRIFHLGQWADGIDCWLGADGRRWWDTLIDPYQMVPGEAVWVGVDVGLKRDSTAVVTLQKRPDGRWHVTCKIWMPSDDEPVDITDVMEHIRRISKTFPVVEVSFDPRFFDVPAKMLSDEKIPMVEIPQSVERMTSAVGSTFELIKRGDLSHDGDPAFTAQVLNAIPRFNERGFTLQKQKSRGKIDAAIALCLAVDRARHTSPRKKFRIVDLNAILRGEDG